MIHTDGKPTIANRLEREVISEAEFERKLDLRVVRELASDSRYRFAEDADAQAAAEHTIECEQARFILCHFRVAGVSSESILDAYHDA